MCSSLVSTFSEGLRKLGFPSPLPGGARPWPLLCRVLRVFPILPKLAVERISKAHDFSCWPWWPRYCAEHPPLRVPAGGELRPFCTDVPQFQERHFPELGRFRRFFTAKNLDIEVDRRNLSDHFAEISDFVVSGNLHDFGCRGKAELVEPAFR